MMSNKNYVLGTREPSGGDEVWGDKGTKTRNIPLPVVRKNSMGESEDKYMRVKRMYYEEKRNIVVPTHPEEDVNATGKN